MENGDGCVRHHQAGRLVKVRVSLCRNASNSPSSSVCLKVKLHILCIDCCTHLGWDCERVLNGLWGCRIWVWCLSQGAPAASVYALWSQLLQALLGWCIWPAIYTGADRCLWTTLAYSKSNEALPHLQCRHQ